MKEKKTLYSGMPFVTAGAAILLFALIFGMGSIIGYLFGAVFGAAGYLIGRKLFPDVTIEVDAAPKSGNPEVDALITEARAQLKEIEAANDIIKDEALSARIDDISATCTKILTRLEDQPNMLSQLRTFLRYYLPTTKKILAARAKLEGEVTGGESQEIAKNIDSAAATVQEAFAKQLSALDEFRFINLESEMDALRQMMASDGLTEEKAEEKPAEAKDDAEDEFSGLFSQGGK